MTVKKMKVNDKVRRISGTGCLGVIKDIREEVTGSSDENKDRGLLVNVLWDNGTFSYFSPDGLEVVEEA